MFIKYFVEVTDNNGNILTVMFSKYVLCDVLKSCLLFLKMSAFGLVAY